MNVISNRIRYLIGVPTKYLTETNYDQTDTEIRHLCILRSTIIANFTALNIEFRDNQKNIGDIDAIKELVKVVRADGNNLSDHPGSLSRVIMELNAAIASRIETIFPDNDDDSESEDAIPNEWLRRLFIMADNTIDGVREALRKYSNYKNVYPWQMYVNINFSSLEEEVRNQNIVFDDDTLLNVLKLVNQKRPWLLFDFIGVKQPVIVVDCENSDPQRLYNVLKPVFHWVQKVILINDTKGNMLWDEFVTFTRAQTKVEHIKIARLKEQKSLVDYKMVAKTCEEYYANKVRSFVLASSDSDIWALICSLPEAEIFVISEKCKSGDFLEDALTQKRIPYCYMDNMVPDTTELMDSAMDREVRHFLAKGCDKRRAVLNAISKLKIFPNQEDMDRFLNKEY